MTETWSEQILLKKIEPKDLLDAGLPQTFNLFKKKKKKKSSYLFFVLKHNKNVCTWN